MKRITKKYPNGFITLDAELFPPIDQTVLDCEIRNSGAIQAAIEKLYTYEEREAESECSPFSNLGKLLGI